MRHYFLSDAHLFPEPEPHPGREHLVGFLSWLAGNEPGNLWILGDLFDYWFEYRSTVPSGFSRITCALRALSDLGWELDFIPGNHDWWVGPHFREATGMRVHRERWVELEIHGLRLTLAHGDGLGHGDTGYRLIRPLLRSRLSSALFSLIHPSAATILARLFSGTSRRILRREAGEIPGGLLAWADRRLEAGSDVVMTGHTHLAEIVRRERGSLVSLGDWTARFTYSVVSSGGVDLKGYRDTRGGLPG